MLMEVDVLGHGPIINSLSLLPSSPAAPTTPLAPGPAMPAPDDGAPAIHDLTGGGTPGQSHAMPSEHQCTCQGAAEA